MQKPPLEEAFTWGFVQIESFVSFTINQEQKKCSKQDLADKDGKYLFLLPHSSLLLTHTRSKTKPQTMSLFILSIFAFFFVSSHAVPFNLSPSISLSCTLLDPCLAYVLFSLPGFTFSLVS